MSGVYRVAVLVVVVAAITFFSVKFWWRTSGIETQYVSIPDVSLTTLGGQKVSLADGKGNARVVVIWATWCPLCRDTIANIANAKKEFQENPAIVFINRNESGEVVSRYLASIPEVATSTVALLDTYDKVYEAINGFSMPETLFIGKDGSVHYQKHGPMSLEEIKRRMEDLLKKAEN